MNNWKMVFTLMTVIGMLFLTACGQVNGDMTNNDEMNKESEKMEGEEMKDGEMMEEEKEAKDDM